MSFDVEEKIRYARHLALSEIGEEGQERLKRARVLIVGCGGLGSPAALYLASAGIGTLGLVDPDRVETSNLQRQVLFRTADQNELKVNIAQKQLSSLNPRIVIQAYPVALDAHNALEIMKDYDIILDATDNFKTRYLINDACFFLKKPNIFASVTRFEGRLSIFCADGPCYRCLFPAPPEDLILNCAQEGILGAVPGVVGTLQALEAIKAILEIGTSLKNKLVLFDMLTMEFRNIVLERNPDCHLCGVKSTITQLSSIESRCAMVPEISAAKLSDLLAHRTPISLIDVREPDEYYTGSIPGARSIPLSLILEENLDIAIDQSIVLICKSGKRSQLAAQKLLDLGFQTVKCLSGGILEWHRLSPTSLDQLPLARR